MIKNNKHSFSLLLLVVFMIPMVLLGLHSFADHEHTVCHSKTEQHIHQKDVDCQLHLLQHKTFHFDNLEFQLSNHCNIDTQTSLTVHFLKQHQQLSFSLRGPPLYVQV